MLRQTSYRSREAAEQFVDRRLRLFLGQRLAKQSLSLILRAQFLTVSSLFSSRCLGNVCRLTTCCGDFSESPVGTSTTTRTGTIPKFRDSGLKIGKGSLLACKEENAAPSVSGPSALCLRVESILNSPGHVLVSLPYLDRFLAQDLLGGYRTLGGGFLKLGV